MKGLRYMEKNKQVINKHGKSRSKPQLKKLAQELHL